jgi:hypothetical protein
MNEAPKLLTLNASERYPDTIEALKNMLSEAEKGGLVGFVLVGYRCSQEIVTVRTNGARALPFLMVGALENAKRLMLTDIEP